MKNTWTAWAAALALTFGSSFAIADVVILDSTSDALVIGDVLEDSVLVDIPEGALVTLIDGLGETKIVAGPYSGPIGSATSSDGGLEALTASRGSETKVLGAVRAPQWDVED
ncbi:MAG: hypothetical protein ACPGGK_16000 [Pikeienuella sp.]